MSRKYILREGFACLWTLRSFELSGSLPVNEGFQAREYPMYKFVWSPAPGTREDHTYFQEDILNMAGEMKEAPEITFVSGVNYNGIPGKVKNPLNIQNFQGMPVWAWDEAMAIVMCTGVDVSKPGNAQPEAGKQMRPIAFRVIALEGMGSYEPKNRVKAWKPDMSIFAEEDRISVQAIQASIEAAKAGQLRTAQDIMNPMQSAVQSRAQRDGTGQNQPVQGSAVPHIPSRSAMQAPKATPASEGTDKPKAKPGRKPRAAKK